jgi:SHS2 domain-containing protein
MENPAMRGPGTRSGETPASGGVRGLPEGVQEVEHTADTGIEVEAETREDLFHRAALGMLSLVRGGGDPSTPSEGETVVRELRLGADGTDLLLARWLREILYLREVEGLEYVSAGFDSLTATDLEARLITKSQPAPAVWEIKGVTYHGLVAEERPGGWWARVIFDL